MPWKAMVSYISMALSHMPVFIMPCQQIQRFVQAAFFDIERQREDIFQNIPIAVPVRFGNLPVSMMLGHRACELELGIKSPHAVR